MTRLLLTALLAICGLAATAEARPRTVPDQLLEMAETLRLRDAGTAVLAGLYIPDTAAVAAFLKPGAVEVKSLGTDRYGRARVLLFYPGAAQPVQETLLRQGFALAYDRAATPRAWLAAEAAARTAQRGLWGQHGRVQDAQAMGLEGLGQFRLVRGEVTRVFRARDAYYINFGDDWRTDFSVKVPKNAWRNFGAALEVAPGTLMMARGAIIRENGPMIVVTRPEQLERLHAYP